MLATKAGAESNKPSTMRHDGIMRTREGQTHKLESRELGRGDRQNLAALQAIANTNAMLSSMLNAAQRNKVDKLMLKKKKLLTPSACMASSGPHPGDHTQRGSNESQWSDRAQINRETLGVDFTDFS